MLKHLIFTFFLTLLGFSALAQSSYKNALRVKYGLGYYAKQDQVFSPFVHTDWSPVNVSLRYEREAKLKHWIDFSFGSHNASLVPAYTYDDTKITYPHNFLLVGLTYGLGKKIYEKEQKKLWLGGQFQNNIQASTYNFGNVSNFGYFASINVGAWLNYEHRFNNKNRIILETRLPLLSLIARSPYLVNDDEFIENIYSHKGTTTFFEYLKDGKLQTLNRVQQFECNAAYRYNISEKWDAGLAYEFDFLHAAKPARLLSYRHLFTINTAFNF